MKSQTNNKILPINIILQNLREQTNKNTNHNNRHASTQNINQNINKINNHPLTSRITCPQDHYNNINTPRQTTKVISLGKNVSKKPILNTPKQIKDQIFNNNPELNNKKTQSFQSFTQKNSSNMIIDPQINNFVTPKQTKNDQHYFQYQKQQITSKVKPRILGYLQSLQNNSLNLTDKNAQKFEQQTRYGSRCQNMINYFKIIHEDKDKDDIKKLKMQLYKKAAIIYQKNQQLLQKESTILELSRKLDLTLQLNKNLKAKIIQLSSKSDCRQFEIQNQAKCVQLQKQLYQRSREIQCLNKQICDQKLLYLNYQQQTNSSFKLITLKLRQYQLHQKQLTTQLSSYRQKQRKYIQHIDKNDKILNCVNQLLKQKQQQILLSQQSIKTLKQQNNKYNINNQTVQSQIIRQLSAQICDLKQNLRNIQLRIRQMIQVEDQIKKQIQEQKNKVKMITEQKIKLQNINNHMHCQIVDLQYLLTQIQNKDNINKTKGQTQDKDKKYYNSLINKQINKQNINCQSSSSKSSGSSHSKRSTSLCTGVCIDPVTNKRSGSCGAIKLLKQNQHLNALYKQCDRRLHQSYKLNNFINQQIIKRDLKLANHRLINKFKHQLTQ